MQRIYTVSKLTADIKHLLEEKFPFVWVSGEISNFHSAPSGHFYFTLKDGHSQISAVMFAGQNRYLKFRPEGGMEVTGLGKINVYPPRGAYQIIFEYLEPKGIGALQVAFEQLKKRLSDEGLFSERLKKPLPHLPRKISVITSPTGAVIRDILTVTNRRFPNVHMEIIAVRVQGEGAAQEIVSGIELLNIRGDADVAILARGGGSLEDLQAFNSERVARAMFLSDIPIISAVGHETDFTIADFVADTRAATPSAAAELAVPVRDDLVRECARLTTALKNSLYRYMEGRRMLLHELTRRLTDPKRRVRDLRLKTDDLTARLIHVFTNSLRRRREQLSWRTDQIKALSPTAILSRGYSITRTIPKQVIVRDAKTVTKGERLEVMLADGTLICRVEDAGNGQSELLAFRKLPRGRCRDGQSELWPPEGKDEG